ncbi:MAG: hypothetical protein AB1720_01680 [Pseudomonadota bacterium]
MNRATLAAFGWMNILGYQPLAVKAGVDERSANRPIAVLQEKVLALADTVERFATKDGAAEGHGNGIAQRVQE